MKFKIGDIVKIIGCFDECNRTFKPIGQINNWKKYINQTFKITKIDKDEKDYPYLVTKHSGMNPPETDMGEVELELAIITITNWEERLK